MFRIFLHKVPKLEILPLKKIYIWNVWMAMIVAKMMGENMMMTRRQG